jgi:hypothetical protein
VPEPRLSEFLSPASAPDIGTLFQDQSREALLSDTDSGGQTVRSCAHYDRIIFVASRHS